MKKLVLSLLLISCAKNQYPHRYVGPVAEEPKIMYCGGGMEAVQTENGELLHELHPPKGDTLYFFCWHETDPLNRTPLLHEELPTPRCSAGLEVYPGGDNGYWHELRSPASFNQFNRDRSTRMIKCRHAIH